MSVNNIRLDLGYEPRPFQLHLHKNMKRFNVLVCHRRFGKTILAIRDKMDRGLACQHRRPQLAYIAPTYKQAKQVAWEYMKDFVRPIQQYDKKMVRINEQELRIDIDRPQYGDFVRFMLLGADNYDALRGLYLDWASLDEYAQCDPALWGEVVRPALSDRLGGATFIGTPKGQNHFFDIFMLAKQMQAEGDDSWYTALYKASDTGVIPQSELDAAKRVMTDEEYRQEYECDFTAALTGSYYGKQMNYLELNNQIMRVPWRPEVGVQTFWDMGLDDSTAIWFAQVVGKEIHVIDYLEDNGHGLPHYAAEILGKGYHYQRHVLPHDAAQRELSSGKSRESSLKESGLNNTEILERHEVADGIDAARNILPRCWFDKDKTEMGRIALRNYERKWDAKKKIYSSQPLHNWASHSADAFRILAMGIRENYGIMGFDKSDPKLAKLLEADGSYDIFGNYA